MEILLYTGLGVGLIFASEIGGYIWHRYGAHTDILPFVKDTHQVHHTRIHDQAHEDFFYIAILLVLYLAFLFYLYYLTYISLTLLTILYLGVFFPFIWSYYIHSAYHITDHWLNEYEWFQNDKRIHFKHHEDPTKNYGIATHFTDELLGTFDYAFPINKNIDCAFPN